MKLKPTKNRALIRVKVPEDISAGGVVLPRDREGDPKDNPNNGKIIDLGESDRDPGFKVGDRVVFTNHWTTATGMKDVFVVDFDDIVAVIEDE